MLEKKQHSLFIVKMLITVLTLGFFVPSLTAASNQPFKDVPSNHTYFQAISDLKDQNVISGYADGEFKLGNSLTRAEASKIFFNLLNLSSEGINLPFTDVKKDAWYTDTIAALYGAGIINGYEDNTFKPNAPITRAEFTKMVVQSFNIKSKGSVSLPFTDLKQNAWYMPTIETLYSQGLIKGVTEKLFVPGNMIKRGDATWLIYNVTLLDSGNLDGPEVPTEYTYALQSANEYLTYLSFSKKELYDQLLYEGFSESAAQYAVDRVETNWQENALHTAYDYLDFMYFSERGLFDQLLFDGYTDYEAQFAIDNVVTDWYENALNSAHNYLEVMNFSKQGLFDQHQFDNYTANEAQYAIDHVEVDWNDQALQSAIEYLNYSSFTDQELYDLLIYDGYTDIEAQHAIDHLSN